MSINPKRKKHFKKKFTAYILLLVMLGISAFFINIFIVSGKPLYVSPIGKVNVDTARVEKILKDSKISFSHIFSSGDYYLIDISNNGQVKLSRNKDVALQIATLQRILIQLTIEGKSFKSIDFRFAEPVISF